MTLDVHNQCAGKQATSKYPTFVLQIKVHNIISTIQRQGNKEL